MRLTGGVTGPTFAAQYDTSRSALPPDGSIVTAVMSIA